MLLRASFETIATHASGQAIDVSGLLCLFDAEGPCANGVKDSQRFKDTNGWGFFNFGHHAPPYAKTAPVQPKEACAGCHISNADNMVFRKFYAPILNAE